jgi:hypothetical protein
MKRFLFIALLLAISVSVKAQSIAGIDIWSSKQKVEQILESRGYTVYDDGAYLEVYNFVIGGNEFDFARFNFQFVSVTSYFTDAAFSARYSLQSLEQAKKHRDGLASLLKKKYGNEYYEEYEREGLKCYKMGANRKDEDKVKLIIALYKSMSKGGELGYYLDLIYTPEYVVDQLNEF